MASTLTLALCSEIVENEVGAQPSTPLEPREIVNQAGQFFVQMHPWRWLEGRQVRIRTRAAIDITGATWTEATKTLTKTGAFADYDHLSFDTFEVTDGTGATAGTYRIASRTSDDAIVLATSIGSGADGQTDIEGQLPNDQIELPDDFDFQTITAYAMKDGLVGEMQLVSPQEMLDLRSTTTFSTSVSIWALVRYVRDVLSGTPVPRLEIWPQQSEAEEQLVIFYRGGWVEVEDDSDVLSIVPWCVPLFLEVLKAVAMGIEEPEGGSVSDRLANVMAGVVFAKAVEQDGLAQPDIGMMRNTWMTSPATWSDTFSLYRSPFVA